MSRTADDVVAFSDAVDLLRGDLGGRALICSDDFFAGMENLVTPEPAEFDPDAYTERGKFMDGWESRRQRVPGNDWCILELGAAGRILGTDIDTHHFLGNHPPFASLDATNAPEGTTPEWLRDEAVWTTLVPGIALRRGSRNLVSVHSDEVWTHVRLRIHPDGGVARLRVYGDVEPPPFDGKERDLACVLSGGHTLACSDMFFSPMTNLVLPKRSEFMGGGWETRRRRGPGHDWILVRLGRPGELSRAVIDTGHFKGNFPEFAAIDAIYWPDAPTRSLVDSDQWTEIVPPTRMAANALNQVDIAASGPWTHVRLRIHPCGGVARLRVFGAPSAADPGADEPVLSWLAGLSDTELSEVLGRCCGSTRWIARMVEMRPFSSWAQLLGEASAVWWQLADADWRAAFEHHPRIGGDVEAFRSRFAGSDTWSQQEQDGVAGASEATLQKLAQANVRYEGRYSHIFIVCATGLTADEMLHRLEERLFNPPPAELRIAAGEQDKITRLRLEKLEVPA